MDHRSGTYRVARDTTVADAEVIDAWERDGFLVFDSLVGGQDLEELRNAYDELLAVEALDELNRMLGGITRQIMMPSMLHGGFESNAALDAAAQMIEPIVGATVKVFDMLIFKPPGHPHETPWHQDVAYGGMPAAPAGTTIRSTMMQFWVALDDVDAENGCMHFVPGVHQQPSLPHVVAAGDGDDPARLLALEDPIADLPLGTAVSAPLRAGGATVHGYGTPHYTPPNRSIDRPRRAYIFNLASKAEFTEVDLRDLDGAQITSVGDERGTHEL
jgi:ectoine hydroxylase-related dioxygenase (phytanoyl-CoA dioxygenase family)